MRIKILQFRVVEKYVRRPYSGFWNWLFKKELPHYHFDVVMRVDEHYIDQARPLEKSDVLQLPNGLKLMVWNTERMGIVKAKTFAMTVEDIRDYHPIEMYLVYPRVHEHINDRAV